jgi:hypothetical protein
MAKSQAKKGAKKPKAKAQTTNPKPKTPSPEYVVMLQEPRDKQGKQVSKIKP